MSGLLAGAAPAARLPSNAPTVTTRHGVTTRRAACVEMGQRYLLRRLSLFEQRTRNALLRRRSPRVRDLWPAPAASQVARQADLLHLRVPAEQEPLSACRQGH